MNRLTMMLRLGKATTSGLLCSGMLLAAMNAQANQQIAQVPLSLSEGVSPNMIFTLDDSTSMHRAYVPDSGYPSTSSRRFRAADANPMAYDPNVTYHIPPAFNKNGSVKTLSTSFDKAWYNGFNPRGDSEFLNLRDGYIVASQVAIGTSITSTTGVNNPSDDFNCTLSLTNGSTGTCSGSGKYKFKNAQLKIKRTDGSRCQAFFELDTGATINVSGCSQTSGNGARNATINRSSNRSVPAYYYVRDEGCLDDLDKCYSAVIVSSTSGQLRDGDTNAGLDERQNFANWFSFYRSRSLATVAAASLAFYNLDPSIRFTWQALGRCNKLNGGSNCGDNKFREFTAGHRGEFFHWMHTFPFTDVTPLPTAMRRAGEFYKTSTPWDKYLNNEGTNTDANTYACRPSYHVLMTDGMWQTNLADSHRTDISRRDGGEFTLPEGGWSYPDGSHTHVYVDNASAYTVADVAMNYWANDLRTGLDNKVPAYIPFKNSNSAIEFWDPRNNPATWQHMSNFIMGLGLSGSLGDDWEGSTHSGNWYQNKKLGNVSWPEAYSSTTNIGNVYDLWHAAINSRGEFYSVDDPDAMVQAFSDILTRIADRKASAAMPGMSMSLESDGAEEDAADRLVSYFYQTSFDSADGWTGEIQKTKSYREWNENTKQFENVVKAEWKASEKLPANRTIKMANAAGNALVDFTTGNAGQSLQSFLAINPDPSNQSGAYTWQDRLNYIRGTRTHEGVEEGEMRQRSSLLGDFLSSQPVVVSGARYLEGFSNRLEGNTAYTSFMASIANRSPMLYVGGNAGMLHAFDTATGVEKFAFVPTAVFSKLNKLTGHNYSHEYYVDGTPVIADAYDGTSWRTILVGTLRAGGKGLFALDVTDPADISLLWELHENSSEAEDLDVKPGYSFSKPTVARLHNGKWAVVTGNGYESDDGNNGAASLYIIDAFSGDMIKELKVQSGETGPNGLSTPRLVDYDSDGVADYAYAGDLHGNLWRFDLLGAGANKDRTDGPIYGDKTGGTDNFKVSYGGKPMFIAESSIDVNGSKVRQPITSAPSVVRHPTRTGYLVVFGTGRYLYQGDKAGETSHAQTLYGIWDMKTKAESTAEDIIPPGKLVSQSITSQTTGTGETTGVTRTARVISNNSVEWYKDFDSSKDVEKRGWRLELQVAGSSREGEMMIEDMRTLGNTLFIQTLVPNADPCGNGADNWLYAINPATGGKTLHHAFDTRGTNDVIVSAIKFGSEGGVSIGQDETGFKANAPGDVEPITPDPSSMGRQSWRMIQAQ